ncbi:13233_t:CDS:2 [Ambispora leptoticha]|uniref:Xylulose kinase n=1 Tax=Ambispora leptoticha TaxID=144679 RepID=A0A9N9F0R4_9GLOM|nr:13233_t:CDS:2 [Ambispora leptoticha]
MENLFFGLDLSTQQLKLTVVDENSKVILEESVNFDKELPEYGTKNGVIANGNIITSPTLMWVAAVDRLFTKLQSVGFPFRYVKAVSGAGQQHGSVYWRNNAANILANLDPSQSLVTQLSNCFSILDSPTWQDSSTTQECRQLESIVSGPEMLAKLTGSKAYERFTGNQIAKIYRHNRQAYDETERISLVSSFLATLFLGKYAQIDVSDGSGMNLLNIYTKEWDNRLLEACGGSELRQKLGEPEKDGFKIIGKISEYFIKRYGFDCECMILPFMGDNPSSLLSLRLESGDIVISLGTSDTVLLLTNQADPNTESHTLCHPIDPNTYISMLCYKNGSLTREYIRDVYANKSWNKFNEILLSYPHPHENKIGFYFRIQEITPFAHGIHRFVNQELVEEFDDPKYNARAILESQFMSMRIRTEKLMSDKEWKRIIAIGGASENTEILKVLTDVFGVDVWRYSGKNSAGYGAALKALMTTFRNANSSSSMSDLFMIADPSSENTLIYERMLNIYQQLELRVLNHNQI